MRTPKKKARSDPGCSHLQSAAHCTIHICTVCHISRKLSDNIVTVTNNVLHTFLKIFAVVKFLLCFPIIAYTGRPRPLHLSKTSHNEGDISTRVLPLSVNFFLYINMGTACSCSTFARPNYDIQNGCASVQTCIVVEDIPL